MGWSTEGVRGVGVGIERSGGIGCEYGGLVCAWVEVVEMSLDWRSFGSHCSSAELKHDWIEHPVEAVD